MINKILSKFKRNDNDLITDEDMKILASHTDIELADFNCELNSWRWPEQLPNKEDDTYIRNGRRSQLMRRIESIVGNKLISRRWNKDRMTDDEHELFWGVRSDFIKESK